MGTERRALSGNDRKGLVATIPRYVGSSHPGFRSREFDISCNRELSMSVKYMYIMFGSQQWTEA